MQKNETGVRGDLVNRLIVVHGICNTYVNPINAYPSFLFPSVPSDP